MDKFEDEQDLLNAYVNGEIAPLETVTIFAPDDVKIQYKVYCKLNNLVEDDKSASVFLDWWYDEDSNTEPLEDEWMDDDSKPQLAPSADSKAFVKWDALKLSELSTSNSAAEVCLWRWKNPTKGKAECIAEKSIASSDVEEWWETTDWIDTYVGGHFHPIAGMKKTELKSFLMSACSHDV